MKRKRIIIYCLLFFGVLAPYIGFFFLKGWYSHKVKEIDNASIVLISKADMRLAVIDYKGNIKDTFPIACGENLGDKQKKGDMCTPEGVFRISEIQDASTWSHDFNDGNGEIAGAYGPYFIRLSVPGHSGIGIHGTHDPESIGTRATEGCIRLNNDDLVELKKQVSPGMAVIITPSAGDEKQNKVAESR